MYVATHSLQQLSFLLPLSGYEYKTQKGAILNLPPIKSLTPILSPSFRSGLDGSMLTHVPPIFRNSHLLINHHSIINLIFNDIAL